VLEVLEVALEVVSDLRRPMDGLRVRDGDLHRQLKRAACSMTLNIAEGSKRSGRDRRHAWRIACGSAEEVRVALRTAVAWGDLEPGQVASALERLDRVVAMLWTMTH